MSWFFIHVPFASSEYIWLFLLIPVVIIIISYKQNSLLLNQLLTSFRSLLPPTPFNRVIMLYPFQSHTKSHIQLSQFEHCLFMHFTIIMILKSQYLKVTLEIILTTSLYLSWFLPISFPQIKILCYDCCLLW